MRMLLFVLYRENQIQRCVFEEFRITIAKQTLSRELRAMGYRKLSARPRHHAQVEGLLNEIVSGTAPIGVLLDPGFPDANLKQRELQDASSAIKRQIIVEPVSNGSEIDGAFATVARQGAGAVLIAALRVRSRAPATKQNRGRP
jgi:hypothetical protein